jgi:hypothetical protein
MSQKLHNLLTGFIVLSGAVQFVQPLVSARTFGIVIAVIAAVKLVLHAVFPNDVPQDPTTPQA